MFSFKKVLLVFIICILCANYVVAADDNQTNIVNNDVNKYYVDFNNGDDFNDGLSQDTPFKTLDKPLFNALNNDSTVIIYLDSGVYYTKNSDFFIMGNVSIIGKNSNDTIISGNNLNRIFTINEGGNLYLKNLTLINGFDEYKGGAIYNSGNLVINNCIFKYNHVYKGDVNHVTYSAFGGAIYNDGFLTINDSNFTKNVVGSIFQYMAYGGAIFDKKNININNCIFMDNDIITYRDYSISSTASNIRPFQRGAALYSLSDKGFINNSLFVNNQLVFFAENIVGSSTFFAFSEGGAVYIKGNNWTFINSSFKNNIADIGGAISFEGNNTVFNNCSFQNNSAFLGPGIFTLDYNLVSFSYYWHNLTNNKNSNLTIVDCTFKDNLITNCPINIFFRIGYGAGAAYLKIDNIYISNCVFESNGLTEDYTSYYSIHNNYCHGGAIFLYGKNSIVHNSSFTNNHGEVGGAIMNYGFDTLISNSTFINNSAYLFDGGAIFHSIGDLVLKNSSFIDNKAIRYGGSIYAAYDYADYIFDQKSVYDNLLFVNNSALYGGAIWDNGNWVIVNNSAFIKNSAHEGGAVYKQGFSNTFENSLFEDNSAMGSDYSNGGAIYNYGSNSFFNYCNFIDNSADNWGGAIYNFGNDLYLANSSFVRNSAFKGGASYLNGAKGRVQDNTFNENHATNGGAIYNSAEDMIISYNSFKSNKADVSGGAIYSILGELVLYGNSMEDCHSKLSGYGEGDYIYTTAPISYLVVSFLNNKSFNIFDKEKGILFANVTDNMGNPVSGGTITFLLFDNLTGESKSIGVSNVIEGIAYLEYGEGLDFGSYFLSGSYSNAAEPVLTKRGILLSVLSSNMIIDYDTLEILLGNDFFYEIILMDSNENFISNAEIFVYEDGVLINSLFTNDAGYVNSSFNDVNFIGIHHYTFVYSGDLVHGRIIKNLNISVIYNNDYLFEDILFKVDYPIVITTQGSDIPFEFYIGLNESSPLYDVSTYRYFSVYKNGNITPLIYYHDYIGEGFGTDGLYYITVIQGHVSHIHWISPHGSFLMPIREDVPGLYVYNVVFKGGLVKRYDSTAHNHVNEEDNYYKSANVSIVLVIDWDSADIRSKISVDGRFNVSEIDIPKFNVNLTFNNGLPLVNREIKVYDEGKYLGSLITDDKGLGEFIFPNMMNVGEHLIEFVCVGDEQLLSCYDAFMLNVYENPNKLVTNITNMSSLNVVGLGNNFTGVLRDISGNVLSNCSVDIEVFKNNSSIKNFTLITNDDGLFSIPLDWGTGDFIFNCVYKGDKYYKNNTSEFNVKINKVPSLLFGVSSIEVSDNNTYLTLVLVDSNFNVMPNCKVKIEIYSFNYNITFYVFTNEYGIVNLKLNLPVNFYFALSSFEGNEWYDKSGIILTNISVYGDSSCLLVNKSVFIKKGEYYSVKLVDSKNNPLVGQTVIINVNGVDYDRVTDNNGFVRLKINLQYGSYVIFASFKGNLDYKGFNIISKLYVVDNDYKMPSFLSSSSLNVFRGSGIYSIRLTDSFDRPIANKEIIVFVNNEYYKSFTNDSGIATLNLKLKNGVYNIVSIFNGDDRFQSSEFYSKLRFVNDDADVTFLNSNPFLLLKGKGHYFNVTLRDKIGNPLSNCTVSLMINGVKYDKITDEQGIVRLKINLNPGSYDLNCIFEGSDEYFFSESFSKIVVVNENKLVKINLESNLSFIGKGRIEVKLTDENNFPLVNKNLVFLVNGVYYNRLTNNNGFASLNINLNPGNYSIKVFFPGNDVYSKANVNYDIIIKSTIYGSNLIKYYKNDTQFEAYLINLEGNPLKNTKVSMNINGIFYVKTTDNNGFVKLNINLNPGDYIITVIDDYGIKAAFNITVLSTILIENFYKVHGSSSTFDIEMKDLSGNILSNAPVVININGVFYEKFTDDIGIAHLNINLAPGNYIATVMDKVNALKRSVNVNVLNSQPILYTLDNVLFKGKENQFKVKFSDETGINLIGESVNFYINGVNYCKIVDKEGFAKLNINLNPGIYNIHYSALSIFENESKITVV